MYTVALLFYVQQEVLEKEAPHPAEPKVCSRLPAYRGTSLTRKGTPLGPRRRPMPRVQGRSQGGGRFLVSEVPLHRKGIQTPMAQSRSTKNRLDDKVDSDQQVVNKELSLCVQWRRRGRR